MPTDYKKMYEACKFQELADEGIALIDHSPPRDAADAARMDAGAKTYLENAPQARDLYEEAQPELKKQQDDAMARRDLKTATEISGKMWDNFRAFCKPPLS